MIESKSPGRTSITAKKSSKASGLEQSAGTATGLDVAQQETAVALLNAALPPLLQQFRQTVYTLAVLIGKTPESVDVDMGTLTGLSIPPVVEGLPSQLLARPSRCGRSRTAN